MGAVEVSIDGGSTWRPAAGRENWTFTYTPSGSVDLRTRAADDSGNLGPPPPGEAPPGGHAARWRWHAARWRDDARRSGGSTRRPTGGGSTGGGSTGGGSTGGVRRFQRLGRPDRAPYPPHPDPRAGVPRPGPPASRSPVRAARRVCTVRLRLFAGRKTIASGTLTVDGGKTRTAALRLSRSARRSLARKGTQSVTVAATARDAAGNSTSTRTTIRLLAPARR